MERLFYIIEPAVDTKETGKAFPAVESYENYDFKSADSVHHLDYHSFPDFIPDIRFKLAKTAKICDMMSQAAISARGFLISEKLKLIFESIANQIIPHRFYPATIEDHDGVFHTFFWMHFVWEEGKDLPDYKKSKFIVRKFSKVEGYLEIENYTDYLAKKEEIGFIKRIDFEHLFIKQPDYEIFSFPLDVNIYSTSKVIPEFDNCSGISITPSTKLSI